MITLKLFVIPMAFIHSFKWTPDACLFNRPFIGYLVHFVSSVCFRTQFCFPGERRDEFSLDLKIDPYKRHCMVKSMKPDNDNVHLHPNLL